MKSLANELAALLSTARTPGDFYTSGASAMYLPLLEVRDVGPIALPLLPAQAEQLIAVAARAPYGRGAQTLIDTDVRRTWQIDADRVRIQGRNWTQSLDAIVVRAAAGLGVTAAVTPELYKLLVYDQGSFFISHRDTEKAPGMFATLIIALPSVHEGGDLLVRHKGREARLDLRGADPSEAAFAAFYVDCVHEVLPVTSGCRLALVYNLLRRGPGRLPRPPSHETEAAGLAALLTRWSADKGAAADDTPEKLVYILEHAYTAAELGFPVLKGADAAAAAVLTAAAQASDCELHVALLTIAESGSAQHTGYQGRSRWGRGRHDEEDLDEFEIDEVSDRTATLAHWGRPDGSPAQWGPVPFDDEELCPAGALDEIEPDEQYFQEASGNEGASFERTYRRAALVLWPRQRRLAVLNQAGLSATLPHLTELARRWAGRGEGRESALWREAHELSGHMLRTWGEPTHRFREVAESSAAARVLAVLMQLKDALRIDAVVVDVIAAGEYRKSDNETLLSALALLPARRAGELMERIVSGNAASALGACADLLSRSARHDPAGGGLGAAANAIVEALPGNPARVLPAELTWRTQGFDVSCIVDLMMALSRIDARVADRTLRHMLAWPKTYDLDGYIVPAARRLAEVAELRDLPAIRGLRAASVKHLRARVAQVLEPPVDWARAGALDCRCQHCTELSRFLISPTQKTWVFKAAERDRSHVMASIGRDGCDVDGETERRGSPYSLVCTKNQASYDRRVIQRKQDLDDLGRIA